VNNQNIENKDPQLDQLDQLNTWQMVLLIGMLAGGILLIQGMWNFISGLYFPYAYQAIVMPYAMYLLFSFHQYAVKAIINKTKLLLLNASFALLFLPSVFLFLTGQVDGHTVIFGEFNPKLNHLPYSYLLPFVFFGVLVAPIKNRH
jgi:hypothetical protein